jgi:branched-chain amino acid transport system ATP-binding protein
MPDAIQTHGDGGRLKLSRVSVRFGAVAAVSDVDAVFEPGTITGLIGPNGAGKTTLLNAICGLADMSAGSINLDGADLTHLAARDRVDHGLVRGFQTVRLMERETLFDNVLVGCERLPQPGLLAQMFDLPAQRRSRRRDLDVVSVALSSLGLLADAHRTVAELPFATRRLTEIARMLLVRPKVMLLDEPAAGLDTAERRRLTETLQAFHTQNPFTLIVIEHDVDLVRRLCRHALALAEGRIIASGAPSAVLETPAVRTAYFGWGHHA